MDLSYFIFLSSGLFLGWSLGANDAANVFGTAVGTKMVKFRTAAFISSLFIIIGAVYAGEGASETLGKLGHINTLAGAFMVALAAGAVYPAVFRGVCPSAWQSGVSPFLPPAATFIRRNGAAFGLM